MGQRRLHMIPVDFMYVQDSLVFDVLYLQLRSPVDYLGTHYSINTIFVFYQAIL